MENTNNMENSNNVHQTGQDIIMGKKVLSFDFISGELVVKDQRNDKPNEVVVDSAYKDGFFCNN